MLFQCNFVLPFIPFTMKLSQAMEKSPLDMGVNGDFTPFFLLNILDIVELHPHLVI